MRNRCVKLPKDDLDTFYICVNFLYNGTLAVVPLSLPMQYTGAEERLILAGLYTFLPRSYRTPQLITLYSRPCSSPIANHLMGALTSRTWMLWRLCLKARKTARQFVELWLIYMHFVPRLISWSRLVRAGGHGAFTKSWYFPWWSSEAETP